MQKHQNDCNHDSFSVVGTNGDKTVVDTNFIKIIFPKSTAFLSVDKTNNDLVTILDCPVCRKPYIAMSNRPDMATSMVKTFRKIVEKKIWLVAEYFIERGVSVILFCDDSFYKRLKHNLTMFSKASMN